MPSEAEAFVLELVQALHRHGLPAQRIEDALQRVGKRLGLELNVFTVPTGITLGIGPLATQHVRLLRVQPGSIHLGRTHALAELIEEIDGGRLDVAGARARLAQIEREGRVHGPLALVAAFALASAASAVFFGARAAEVVVSGAIGAVVGGLASGAERHARVARLFEVLAAAAAAFVAGLVTHVLPGLERESVVLASIIVLLPGYTLTVAMNELAARHYSSGTARLGGVLATMFLLACGAAVGTAAADAALALLPAAGAERVLAPLPAAAPWLALLVSPLAFKVLFQARDVDTPWIVAAAWLAYLGARAGTAWLGPLLGAGCGSFVLGLASNGLARLRLRPAAITAVPGMLVLVPGSLGFRGVSSFLAQDALPGVELVARMLAVAMALVSGLLLAGVVVPSQRTL